MSKRFFKRHEVVPGRAYERKLSIWERSLACILAAFLVATSIDLSVFADENNTDITTSVETTVTSKVVGIESLAEDVANQKVNVGGDESAVVFPDTFNATVEVTTETTTIVNTGTSEDDKDLNDEDATGEVLPEDNAKSDVNTNDIENTESVNDLATDELVESQGIEEQGTQEQVEPIEPKSVVQEINPSESEIDSSNDIAFAPIKLLKKMFSAMVAFASDDSATKVETKTEAIKISWELNTDLSSKESFLAVNEGDVFVYNAVNKSDYEIKEGITMPQITVTIKNEDSKQADFEKTELVDGVLVKVTADAGVFPADATLSVRKVTKQEEEQVESVVEEERAENVNVAKSFTFDIKVLDKAENEIEPDTSKGTVKVSFTLAEVKNENLETEIYHVKEAHNGLDAEKLETSIEGSTTAMAETDGFSYYTVEFTYEEKQYVMQGDTEVLLRDILDYVGIVGTATSAITSNPSLFSAEEKDGEWYIVAHKAFTSEEWLKVTVDGIEINIVVTDDAAYLVYVYCTQWDNDTEKNGSAYLSKEATLPFSFSILEAHTKATNYYTNNFDGILSVDDPNKILVWSKNSSQLTVKSAGTAYITWTSWKDHVKSRTMSISVFPPKSYAACTYKMPDDYIYDGQPHYPKIFFEYSDDPNAPVPRQPYEDEIYLMDGNYLLKPVYDYSYWYTDSTQTKKWYGDEVKEKIIEPGTYYLCINSMSHYATSEYGESPPLYLRFRIYIPESNVAFDGNGGTSPSPVTVPSGDSMTLPSSTRDHYQFAGWYTSADGGTRVGGNGDSYTPSSDITLYAHWNSVPATAPTLSGYTGTYDKQNHTITSSGGSGGTVKYSLDKSSWSTTKPSKRDAGTYTVYAKTEGDSTHQDSNVVSANIIINKKTIGLNWSNTTFTYDGKAKKPSATATGLISGATCTVTVSGEQINAGTYTATASALSNNNYAIPSAKTKEFTINPCETTITISVDDVIYTGQQVKPAPTVKADANNNAVIPASEYTCDYANNINHGTATVTVKDKADGNYIITTNSKDFTVIPKNLDNTDKTGVTYVAIPNQIYSGKEHTPDVTINYNEMYLAEGVDFDVVYANNIKAGTAKVTLTGKGNYKGTVVREFIIDPLPLTTAAEHFTLKISGNEYIYDGAPKVPVESLIRGGITGSDNIILIPERDYNVSFKNSNTAVRAENGYSTKDKNAVDAGTITLRVTGTGNYTGYLETTYKIIPNEVEVYGLIAIDRQYDGTNVVAIDPSKATLYGYITGDEISVATSTVGEMYDAKVGDGKSVNLSTVEITGKHASDYVLTSVDPVKVNISKRELSADMFSFENRVPVTYNSEPQTPQLTLTDMNGSINMLSASDVSFTYADNIHAGTATVTVAATESGNYSGSVQKTFTINPAQITLSARNTNSTYGYDIVDVSELVDITGTIYDVDKENMAIKGITSVKKGYAAGAYENANSVSYNKSNKDYSVTVQKATYTVTKCAAEDAIKVTANNYEGIYDGSAHTFGINANGLVVDDIITIYYSESELNDGNYATGTTTKPTYTDAGEYIVYYYAVSDNYSGGKAGSVTVTINQAPLSITPASDKEIDYGQDITDIPAPSLADLTIVGFVNADSDKVKTWSGNAGYVTSYEKFDDVGNYLITPEIKNQTTDSLFKNYVITAHAAKLTVKSIPVKFTWDGNTSVAATGNAIYHMATVDAASIINNDNVTVGGYVTTGEAAESKSYAYQASTVGTYRAQVNKLGGTKAVNYYIEENEATAFSDWQITEGTTSTTATNKIVVTAKPSVTTITYGSSVPEFTYEYVVYNSENQVLDTQPELATVSDGSVQFISSYAVGDGVGEYEVTPYGLTPNNDYTVEYVAGHFSVTKASNNITDFSMNNWYYGDTPSEPKAIAIYGEVKFEYQEVKEGIADWNIFNWKDNKVPTEAGTYRIYAYVDASDNYEAYSESKEAANAHTFTIKPAELKVSVKDKSSIYGGDIAALDSVTSVAHGKVSEEEITSLAITETTTATKTSVPGKYPITADYTANNNIAVVVTPGEYTITKKLIKLSDTIGANGSAAFTFDGQPHGINVPSIVDEGGNAIDSSKYEIYYSTSPLTASNYGSGSTIVPTIVNAASQTIYYYVASDYYGAFTGSGTVTINKKLVTVTAKDKSIPFGSDPANDGVTYTGFVEGDTAESLNLIPKYSYYKKNNGGSVSDTMYAKGSSAGGAGEYAIVPSGLEADNYSFEYANGTMTVLVGVLMPEMFEDIPAAVYSVDENGNPALATPVPVIKATYRDFLNSSDFTVTYENNVNVGTATVTISPTSTGNYSGSEPIVLSFTINPKAVTVEAGDGTSSYNSRISEIEYTVTNGNLNTHEIAVLDLRADTTAVKGSPAGTYKTFINHNNNANYIVTSIDGIYTVTGAAITVNAKGYTGVYDGREHSGTVTAKTGSLFADTTVYYSTVSVAEAAEKADSVVPVFTAVGNYTVYYYVKADNYESVSGSYDVNISPMKINIDVIVTPDGDSYGYSFKATLPDGTDVTDNILDYVTGEIKYTTNYTEGAADGSYLVSANGFTPKLNYALNYTDGVIIVGAPQNVFTELQMAGWIYGDTPSNPVCQNAYGTETTYKYYVKTDNGYTLTTTNNGASEEGGKPLYAGDYAVEAIAAATTKGETQISEIASGKVDFIISKRPVIIIASDVSSSYGESISTLTYNTEVICDVDGNNTKDNVSVDLSTIAGTDGNTEVGEYPIKVGEITGEQADNYVFTKSDGIYSITSAGTVSVTANDVSVTYDGLNHGISITADTGSTIYYSNELLDSKNYKSGTTTPITYKNAGEYQIYYYVVAPGKTGVAGSKKVTINKKTVTVKPENQSIYYGDAIPAINNITYSGLEAGETVVGLNLNAVARYNYTINQDVGTYEIDASITDTQNYHFVIEKGTLTVIPKVLTFTWSKDAFFFDGDTKIIEASIDNLANQTDDVILVYADNSESEVGNYTAKITSISGNKASNYRIDPVTSQHQWKIKAGDNAFTGKPAINNWTYGDTPSESYAQSRYGEPVFEYSDSAFGPFTATKPTIPGTYFMRAVVPETDSYEGLESEPVEFTIRKGQLKFIPENYYGRVGDQLYELTYTTVGNIAKNDAVTPILSTTATTESELGDYPITIDSVVVNGESYTNTSGQIETPLYDITLNSGTYHLTGFGVLLKTDDEEGTEYDEFSHKITGHAYGLKATITGNLEPTPVVYYSSREYLNANQVVNAISLGRVSTQTPRISAAGEKTIYYYVLGEGNDLLALGSKTITVINPNKPSQTAPECVASIDGTITVTSGFVGEMGGKLMYKPADDGEYTLADSNVISGLAPGKYYVCYGATENALKSPDTIVTIGPKLPEVITGLAKLSDDYSTAEISGVIKNAIAGQKVIIRYGFGKNAMDSEIQADISSGSYSLSIENLEPNKIYFYQAVVVDADGNEVTAGEVRCFVTRESGENTIDVNISNASGETKFAVITVERGNDPIACSNAIEIAAGANVSSSFGYLPDGNYNIVVRTSDDSFIETKMIVVKEGVVSEVEFTIVKGEVKSVVEVKTEDTPAVAASGLDTIISEYEKNQAANGDISVKVELAVEKKSEDEAEGKDSIIALVDKETMEVAMYLDLSLFKTIETLNHTGEVTSIERREIGTFNDVVLEIAVPYDDTSSVGVIRYHDGVASELTLLSEGRALGGNYQDGYFAIEDGYIFIYANGFSTYAFIAPKTVEEEEQQPIVDPIPTPGETSNDEGKSSTTVEEEQQPIVVPIPIPSETSNGGGQSSTNYSTGILPMVNTEVETTDTIENELPELINDNEVSKKTKKIASAVLNQTISDDTNDSATVDENIDSDKDDATVSEKQTDSNETIEYEENQSCYWHYIIFILALIGAVICFLIKKSLRIILAVIDVVLMIVCVLLGHCKYDLLVTLIGTIFIGIILLIKNSKEENNKEKP